MDTYTQSLLTENAVLKERCSHLQDTINRQAEEVNLWKKLYYDFVQLYSKPVMPPVAIPFQYNKGCPKCGIGADGGPLGYVCNDPRCPCGLGGVQCSTSTTK